MQFKAVGWWRCAHAVKSGVTNSPVAEGICNRLSGAATSMPTDGLAFVRASSSAAGSQAGQQSVQNSLLVNTLDMVGRAQQSLTLHQFSWAATCKFAVACLASRTLHVIKMHARADA